MRTIGTRNGISGNGISVGASTKQRPGPDQRMSNYWAKTRYKDENSALTSGSGSGTLSSLWCHAPFRNCHSTHKKRRPVVVAFKRSPRSAVVNLEETALKCYKTRDRLQSMLTSNSSNWTKFAT